MRMKFKKSVVMGTSAVLALSLVSPVAVVSAKEQDSDQLYTLAYDAVEAAKNNGDQASVNKARKAVKALIGTKAQWAAGEFSKQIDAVQEKLFEKFMDVLYYAGGIIKKDWLTIDEINTAEGLLEEFKTYEGNAPYVSCWSSAVDKHIQAYIYSAMEYYHRFEYTADEDVKNRFYEYLHELEGLKYNKGVLDWVKNIRAEVEAMGVRDDYKTISMDNSLELLGVRCRDVGDVIIDTPENLNVTYDKDSDKLKIKLYNEWGGMFRIFDARVFVKVDYKGDITYEVQKDMHRWFFWEGQLGMDTPKIKGVYDKAGNVSSGIQVEMDKMDNCDGFYVNVHEAGEYRVIIGDDTGKEFPMLITVDEYGCTNVYYE